VIHFLLGLLLGVGTAGWVNRLVHFPELTVRAQGVYKTDRHKQLHPDICTHYSANLLDDCVVNTSSLLSLQWLT